MPRGLGFGSLSAELSDDETLAEGGAGLTLPPPKPKASPTPLPKDALANEGARLGFVSREPGEGVEDRATVSAPTLEGTVVSEAAVPASQAVASAPRAGKGAMSPDAKPAPRLKGRRRVAQSKLLIAGRKAVLDEFQQFAWERDLPYWEALALLMEQQRER